MPNCFQLIDKKTNKPEVLQKIDELLCANFDVPVHPERWLARWYDSIGFYIATGKALGSQELRKVTEDFARNYQSNLKPNVVDILDYLEENYTSNAWASR